MEWRADLFMNCVSASNSRFSRFLFSCPVAAIQKDLKQIKRWSECVISVVFLWILTFFVEINKSITKKKLSSFQVFLWYFLSFCTRRCSNLWFSIVIDILKYYESFFLSCGTVRYAVKDAVIILGTILKCYYQMKARKPYFPAEAVRRLSYLIYSLCFQCFGVANWNKITKYYTLSRGFNYTAVQDRL